MKNLNLTPEQQKRLEEAKAGWIVLWLMGVPASVLFVLFLLRGCT